MSFFIKSKFWTAKIAFSTENKRGRIKLFNFQTMKAFVIVILLFWVKTSLATEPVYPSNVKPENLIGYSRDSLQTDSALQGIIGRMLGLTQDVTIESCDLYWNDKGEILKVRYERADPEKSINTLQCIYRTRARNKIIFTNIIVVKEKKKISLPDKTVIIQ
jgi:hypothetical protein